MGIKNLWTDVLELFNRKESLTSSKIAEMHPNRRIRLAVDVSIWLNKNCVTDVDKFKLATTCNPPYPAPDLLEKIQSTKKYKAPTI
jgi:hypothetical protein